VCMLGRMRGSSLHSCWTSEAATLASKCSRGILESWLPGVPECTSIASAIKAYSASGIATARPRLIGSNALHASWGSKRKTTSKARRQRQQHRSVDPRAAAVTKHG